MVDVPLPFAAPMPGVASVDSNTFAAAFGWRRISLRFARIWRGFFSEQIVGAIAAKLQLCNLIFKKNLSCVRVVVVNTVCSVIWKSACALVCMYGVCCMQHSDTNFIFASTTVFYTSCNIYFAKIFTAFSFCCFCCVMPWQADTPSALLVNGYF